MGNTLFLSVILGSFFTQRNGLIVALVLGTLSFFLIVSFVVLYFLKKDVDTKEIIKKSINEKGRIYDAIRDMFLNDHLFLDDLSRRIQSKHSLTQTEIESIVHQIVNKALEDTRLKKKDDAIQQRTESTRNDREGAKSKAARELYASCVDVKKPVFISVTTSPQDDTIFVLELNPEDENDATFTVYEKAFRKVIEEQGFLKDGCAIENPEMNSTNIIRTIEPGLAFRKDGEWVIKKQAKVKFE